MYDLFHVDDFAVGRNASYAMSYSPDGKYLATGCSKCIRLWSVCDNYKFIEAIIGVHSGTIRSLNYSLNGEYIVSASYDGTVRIIDLKNKKGIDRFVAHNAVMCEVKYLNDEDSIVTSSWDNTLRRWGKKSLRQSGEKVWQLVKECSGFESHLSSSRALFYNTVNLSEKYRKVFKQSFAIVDVNENKCYNRYKAYNSDIEDYRNIILNRLSLKFIKDGKNGLCTSSNLAKAFITNKILSIDDKIQFITLDYSNFLFSRGIYEVLDPKNIRFLDQENNGNDNLGEKYYLIELYDTFLEFSGRKYSYKEYMHPENQIGLLLHICNNLEFVEFVKSQDPFYKYKDLNNEQFVEYEEGNHSKHSSSEEHHGIIDNELNNSETEETLINQGEYYKSLGNYKRAKEFLNKALILNEKKFGLDHPKTAQVLNMLGDVYLYLGSYEKAQRLLERALIINKKNLDPNHPSIADTLQNLGNLYGYLGDCEKQKFFLEQALVISEKNYGDYHIKIAKILTNLGLAYINLENYEEAKKLLIKALTINEDNLSPTHINIAITLNGLGVAYMCLGDYGTAKELFDKVLVMRIEKFGPDHTETGITLLSLGRVHRALGKNHVAYDFINKAYNIFLKFYGNNHNYTKVAYSFLVEIANDLEKDLEENLQAKMSKKPQSSRIEELDTNSLLESENAKKPKTSMKNTKLKKNEQESREDGGCCYVGRCTIYTLPTIIYDNPLLNIPFGLKRAATMMGVSAKDLLNITTEDHDYAEYLAQILKFKN
jgi:tetratricopeptide (TPR) repeat protein